MGASSVTGTGLGDSGKLTTRDLAVLANGPVIMVSGIAVSEDINLTSPPTPGGSVVFPHPLAGAASHYAVILTTHNGGSAFVTTLAEDSTGFTGFSFITESECDLMYIVARNGFRASVAG